MSKNPHHCANKSQYQTGQVADPKHLNRMSSFPSEVLVKRSRPIPSSIAKHRMLTCLFRNIHFLATPLLDAPETNRWISVKQRKLGWWKTFLIFVNSDFRYMNFSRMRLLSIPRKHLERFSAETRKLTKTSSTHRLRTACNSELCSACMCTAWHSRAWKPFPEICHWHFALAQRANHATKDAASPYTLHNIDHTPNKSSQLSWATLFSLLVGLP